MCADIFISPDFYKEHAMSHSIKEPYQTSEGVIFTVTVDSLKRECLIKEEALQQLSSKNTEASTAGMMDVFHAFEDKINGVARRLVSAGVQGTPLVLSRNTFAGPPR
jgi:hypothetical protein